MPPNPFVLKTGSSPNFNFKENTMKKLLAFALATGLSAAAVAGNPGF